MTDATHSEKKHTVNGTLATTMMTVLDEGLIRRWRPEKSSA